MKNLMINIDLQTGKRTILVIDGNTILFRCNISEEDLENLVIDLKQKQSIESFIESLKQKFQC